MRMTGVRPEVGARLIHLPLSANFSCNFLHFEGPIYRFYHSLFCRCLTQKNMCCRIREPENG